MDLNLLQLFAAVAKADSFSAAGDSFGIERSSVSRGIASLERTLGAQLFSRTTRRIALTSAGAAFHKEIEPHLAAIGSAMAIASERDQPLSGLLRVSVAVDMAISFMPKAFAGFNARYPGVRLDVRVENRRADLIHEGIDAALRIVVEPLVDSTFLAIKLSTLAFRAYASPAYLSTTGYPSNLDEAARLRWMSFKECDFIGFPKAAEQPFVIADDMLFLHQLALAGLGVASLPTFLPEQDVAAGRLSAVLPDQISSRAELYLLHAPARRLSRRVRAFSDYLIRYFDANPLTPQPTIAAATS